MNKQPTVPVFHKQTNRIAAAQHPQRNAALRTAHKCRRKRTAIDIVTGHVETSVAYAVCAYPQSVAFRGVE